ncbi:hypothetical protein D3C80_945690 [compost metagenome]
MINHEIIHHIILFAHLFNVGPFAKGRINLGIIHRRESAIAGGRVERQQMNSANNPLQVLIQYFV